MKKSILIWLVLQLPVLAFASGRVTVDQLDRVVASNHGKPDGKIADKLFGLELTERLSAAKLAALEAALPGPNSRRALVALADQATFLDPRGGDPKSASAHSRAAARHHGEGCRLHQDNSPPASEPRCQSRYDPV